MLTCPFLIAMSANYSAIGLFIFSIIDKIFSPFSDGMQPTREGSNYHFLIPLSLLNWTNFLELSSLFQRLPLTCLELSLIHLKVLTFLLVYSLLPHVLAYFSKIMS